MRCALISLQRAIYCPESLGCIFIGAGLEHCLAVVLLRKYNWKFASLEENLETRMWLFTVGVEIIFINLISGLWTVSSLSYYEAPTSLAFLRQLKRKSLTYHRPVVIVAEARHAVAVALLLTPLPFFLIWLLLPPAVGEGTTTFTTSVSRHTRRVCVVHLPQADVDFSFGGVMIHNGVSFNAASLVP